MQPILVSACLLGILTRYDGACKRNEAGSGISPPGKPDPGSGLP